MINFESFKGIDLITFAKHSFDQCALAVFKHQYEHNVLYKSYVNLLKIDVNRVFNPIQIPFLPISFFKSHKVYASAMPHDTFFESSGTTQSQTSKHYVADVSLYNSVALDGFESAFGDVKDWTFLALLPSYLERTHSSLVHMVDMLMKKSGHDIDNGFYLHDFEALANKIRTLEQQQKKTMLFGVSFALIDFAEAYPMVNLDHVTIIETGGMKGRKEEWTRRQLHDYLKQHLQPSAVRSEYGMTELLSQGYTTNGELFSPIATMKPFIREIEDPLTVQQTGQGALNIIDLANVHSCSFIATDDIGRIHPDGSFEVLGRIDFSALRGCSLLAL